MREMTSVELDITAHDRPMTAKQAAAYLQVGPDRLRSWELRAGLPTHRLGNGPKAERRYYAAELDAWLKSRCITPAPDQGDPDPVPADVDYDPDVDDNIDPIYFGEDRA